MSIITLTSDLGDNSHYPAILKGVILSLFPSVTLVDVTHNIPDFDLMQAAYVVKHTFPAFPKGSIHVVAIDPERGGTTTGVVLSYQDHFFIAPNNGIMRLICNGQEKEAVAIENEGLIANQ